MKFLKLTRDGQSPTIIEMAIAMVEEYRRGQTIFRIVRPGRAKNSSFMEVTGDDLSFARNCSNAVSGGDRKNRMKKRFSTRA